MKGRLKGQPLCECRFLIPLVRDSTRKLHQPLAWKALHRSLYSAFHGSHSRRVLYVSLATAWGEYEFSNGDGRVVDENREYVVALG